MESVFLKTIFEAITKENITLVILAGIVAVLLYRNSQLQDKYIELVVDTTKSLGDLKHVIEILKERIK